MHKLTRTILFVEALKSDGSARGKRSTISTRPVVRIVRTMNRLIRVSAIAIALLSSGIAFAQSKPQTDSTAPAVPVAPEIPGRYGMVVAQERHAANIGVDILNRVEMLRTRR